MVAKYHKNGDIGFAQPAHLLIEKQPCVIILPIAKYHKNGDIGFAQPAHLLIEK